jgi:hypothetical protein
LGTESEAENQPQCCVNRAKLVEAEMAYAIAETAGIDGARLLGEHQCLVAVDLDRRSERRRASRGRGGCDQPGREGFEVVGLYDDGVATSLLLMSAGISWRA